jgi:hypothetical protein
MSRCKLTQHARRRQRGWISSTVVRSRSRRLVRSTGRAMPNVRCCAATAMPHAPSAYGTHGFSSMRCVARGMQQRCECHRRSPVCLRLAPDARELAVCASRSRCCDANYATVSSMVWCKFTQHTRGRQRRWIRSTVVGSRSRRLVRATERAMPTEVLCSHSGVAHPISVWCICI